MNEELIRQKQAELLQTQRDLTQQLQNAQEQLQNDELLTHYLNKVGEIRTQMREGGDGVITPQSYMEAMAMQQAMLQQRIEALGNEIQRLSRGAGAAPAAPAGGDAPVQEHRRRFSFRSLFRRNRRAPEPPPPQPAQQVTLSGAASAALLRHEVANTRAAVPSGFTPPADTPDMLQKLQKARNGQGMRGGDGDPIAAPYKPLTIAMQKQVTDLIERLEGQGMSLPALLQNARTYEAGVGNFDCSDAAAGAVEATLDLVNQYLRMPAFQSYLKQFYRCLGKGSAEAIETDRKKVAGQDPHDIQPADIHTQAVRSMFTRGINPFTGALNDTIAKQNSLPPDSPEYQALQTRRQALTGLNKIFGKLEVLNAMGGNAPAGLESLMAKYQEMRGLCTSACPPDLMEECIREVKSGWDAPPAQ